MLEIKHLTKIYKTKGGAETKALDDVSVSFGERGLVFLLGKSGSGKSTLLNLAGGLDAPTSGEVVIFGKSSKDFTGSDFDSYRNTYVGFVFQEYNILNEFNLEDNVALALELQGKKGREKVQEILKEVELEGFAKRKPNTLSGGQKQRIAIARALVKDPQIIMADEPTGALDSATGKQVFDTLKSLSKNRLVIVVSHDRASAEEYGDRIVELKDGKIISDVTKTREENVSAGEKVSKVGDDVLLVKGGDADEETVQQIINFLKDAPGEVILSRGEGENAAFKKVNRIDEKGARERFVATDESKFKSTENAKTQPRFIKSRLPMRKAARIGASGLRLKPVRLAFTILLSFFSFVMFGLFSTMMLYDDREVLAESFQNSDYSYVYLSKYYQTRGSYGEGQTYIRNTKTKFTPEEISSFGQDAVGVFSVSLSPSNVAIDREKTGYYYDDIMLISSLSEGHPLREKIVAGSYPKGADEICVSSYFAECMQNAAFSPITEEGEDASTEKRIKSNAELVGEKVEMRGSVFTIAGVFDSGKIPAKYDTLKEEGDFSEQKFLLSYTYESYLSEGLHQLALVGDAFLDAHKKLINDERDDFVSYFVSTDCYYFFSRVEDEERGIYGTSAVQVYREHPDGPQYDILRFDAKSGALGEKEIFVHPAFLQMYLDAEPERDVNMPAPPSREDFESDEEYEKAYEEYENSEIKAKLRREKLMAALEVLNTGYYYDEATDERAEATDEEFQEALDLVAEYFKSSFYVSVTRENYDMVYGNSAEERLGEFTVAGMYYQKGGAMYGESGIYCSQKLYDESKAASYEQKEETKYVLEEGAKFAGVLAPYDGTKSGIFEIADRAGQLDPDTDVYYTIENRLYGDVDFVNEIVGMLSVVFLIVGLLTMVFSALLLFSFISMSIANKKREIGILRAVGARGTDVFKIFFSESGIIVGICTVLALVGSLIVTNILNGILKGKLGFDVTLFVFGPLPMLLMVAVAVFVAVISTFLPVYFAARKKPVESIRAL